ncbi:hypothetical protein RF11_10119 [Thelohanellus kitauei]|uniref:Uncharacterized protein n=1 Tax=Thelohanellus kitauei TaxID=669202 RepID=A0A0C2JHS3_THEKT|nr:hypothetical protein RF11_10119 [Thelohanellus kitauei]
MGYNASKYDIEACYKIIQPGPVVLVGFRFPTFNSLYPSVIYMKIKQEYRNLSSRIWKEQIFQFELMFHSIKCNKTMEIRNFGDEVLSIFTIYLGVDISSQYFTKYNFILDIYTENQLQVIEDHFRLAHFQWLIHSPFNVLTAYQESSFTFGKPNTHILYLRDQSMPDCLLLTYLSRVYLLRYDTLNSLNITHSTTVAVIFVVISQHNSSYGQYLFTLTLRGWRLNCPSTIPLSMLIEDVVFDSSWNEIKIEISIQDRFHKTKETSVINIENGLTTNILENEVVFPGLNFKKIRPTDYLWYTSEIKVHAINIMPLVQLRMTKYDCEIDGQDMILTEYSFNSNIIERCMMAENNYGNHSTIRVWENIEHSYATLCIRRHDNTYSRFWDEHELGYF